MYQRSMQSEKYSSFRCQISWKLQSFKSLRVSLWEDENADSQDNCRQSAIRLLFCETTSYRVVKRFGLRDREVGKQFSLKSFGECTKFQPFMALRLSSFTLRSRDAKRHGITLVRATLHPWDRSWIESNFPKGLRLVVRSQETRSFQMFLVQAKEPPIASTTLSASGL